MAALNDLVFKNWSVSDKTNTLNVRLFRGIIGFSVFPKDRVPGQNQHLATCNLDEKGEGVESLLDVIDQVIKHEEQHLGHHVREGSGHVLLDHPYGLRQERVLQVPDQHQSELHVRQ